MPDKGEFALSTCDPLSRRFLTIVMYHSRCASGKGASQKMEIICALPVFTVRIVYLPG